MKSWVLAAAVVVTCSWVARPLAGSSIESDTESAANAAAGIASAASATVDETASQRNLRADRGAAKTVHESTVPRDRGR